MPLESQVNKLIAEALGQEDRSPFSTSGFDSYIKHITSYAIHLFTLSKYLARTQGFETIPESIVAKSSERIHKTSSDKLLNVILSIAGLLLGSAISHLVTLSIDESQITFGSIIFVMATGLIGAFLFGYYLFK